MVIAPGVALSDVAQVGDLHRRIAVECRTVGQNSADSHIHGGINVDGVFLRDRIAKNLFNKEVGGVKIAAVVATKLRGHFLFHKGLGGVVLPVANAQAVGFLINIHDLVFGKAPAFHHAFRTIELVVDGAGLAFQTAVDAAGNRAVVQGHKLYPGAAEKAELSERFARRGFKPDDLHGPAAGDGQERADAVGAVKIGVCLVAPMIALAVGKPRPAARAVVNVFSLAVFNIADFSQLIPALHFKGMLHVAVVFRVSVDLPALLDRLDELDRLRHCLAGQHLGEHVFSGFKTTNGKGRVFVGVVGQHDGVHIIVKEIIEVIKQSDGQAAVFGLLSDSVEQGLVFVAYRD